MDEGDHRWIAVYTRARSEQSVAQQLHDRGLTSFVPLQRRLHKWSDRSKWVEQPLIPSYVFVLLPAAKHHQLFDVPGLVRVVKFNGRTAVIRPEEIEFLQRTEQHPEAEAVGMHLVQIGEHVQITGGLFAGYSGSMVHTHNGCTVAVRIEELSYAVVVKVRAADVKVT
jgi:transcriptional antiterminator RfaH